MTKVLVVMCLLCSVAVAAPVEPITLKGMAPGMTLEELELIIPNFSAACSPPANLTFAGPDGEPCSYVRPRYRGPTIETFHTFADKYVNSWRFYGRENKLHAILLTFDPENFIEISKALTAKYGAPKISSQTLSNRMNAKFENVTAVWRRGTQTLTATRFAGDIETSSLVLEDSKLRKQVKAPSKDL